MKTWEKALIGVGGATLIGTLIDKYAPWNPEQKWWWTRIFPQPTLKVIRSAPQATNPLVADSRSLGEIRPSLEKKLWQDANLATKAITTLRGISNDLAMGYTLSPQRVDAELKSIGQQRITQLKTRKNQAKQSIETLERSKKGIDTQIKQLEQEISRVSAGKPEDLPKKTDKGSGLWLTADGRLIEESELTAENERLDKQQSARVQQLRSRIEILKRQMPKTDQAYKQFHEVSNKLAKTEEDLEGIPAYVS